MKRYRFRDNCPLQNADAQEIGEFLEDNFPSGNITPDKLVEISQVPNTPTHKYFDWDNKSAAKKWRLLQARQLISALYVELDDGSETRAYESVYLVDTKSYQDIGTIGADESLFEQVIENARRELNYWKLKYNKYRDIFPGVFEAIDGLVISKGVKNEKNKTSKTGRRANY